MLGQTLTGSQDDGDGRRTAGQSGVSSGVGVGVDAGSSGATGGGGGESKRQEAKETVAASWDTATADRKGNARKVNNIQPPANTTMTMGTRDIHFDRVGHFDGSARTEEEAGARLEATLEMAKASSMAEVLAHIMYRVDTMQDTLDSIVAAKRRKTVIDRWKAWSKASS